MYTLGNPLRYSDPSGHATDPEPRFDPGHCQATLQGTCPSPNLDPRLPNHGLGQQDPNLHSIVSNTLEELGTQGLPLTVTYDEDGNPQVDFAPDALRKTAVLPLTTCARGVDGVCGVSISASGNGLGGGARGSVDLFVDSDANFAILLTGGGGGYTPIPGPTSRMTVTGIREASLTDVDGASGQFGLSGAIGVGGAAEAVFLRSDQGQRLKGESYGIAYGGGAEIHLTMTYSHLLYISK